MKQFEYLIEKPPTKESFYDVKSWNKAGLSGWEVVSIIPFEAIIFKREIIE